MQECGKIPQAYTSQPVLYTDNEAVLKLTKTQTFDCRTRYIEHRYNYIRELVNRGAITIQGIKGKENPGDSVTKILLMSMIGSWKAKNYIG